MSIPEEPPGDFDRSTVLLVWNETPYYTGQRVIVRFWAGHLQPEDSGLPYTLNITKRHTGTIVATRERVGHPS